MKTEARRKISTGIMLIGLVCYTQPVWSQHHSSWPHLSGNGGNLTIDVGISLLLAAGATYGLKLLNDLKRKEQKQDSAG